MKKYVFIFFIAATFLGLSSCNNNDDNNGVQVEFKKLAIVKADLPAFFELGKTYEIRATYVRPDGCTYFQGFKVYPQDNNTTRVVEAIGAKYTNTGQLCTEDAVEVPDSFLFQVLYDQTYTFRFWKGVGTDGKDEYLEVTVPIKNL